MFIDKIKEILIEEFELLNFEVSSDHHLIYLNDIPETRSECYRILAEKGLNLNTKTLQYHEGFIIIDLSYDFKIDS